MVRSCAALAAGLTLGVCGVASASGVQSLEVVSNRADLISGGDALVSAQVSGPVSVDLDGVDVTGSFAARPNGRFEGLVTGLKVGRNVLTVRDAAGGGKRTRAGSVEGI